MEQNELYYLEEAIHIATIRENSTLYDIVKIDPELPDYAYEKRAYLLPEGVFGFGDESKKRRIAVDKAGILWIIRDAAKNKQPMHFEYKVANVETFGTSARVLWKDNHGFCLDVVIGVQSSETADEIRQKIDSIKKQLAQAEETLMVLTSTPSTPKEEKEK
ncbi:MAG: hypothetical protein PHW40_05075 [Candidatus Izemoplasmatales bacterium]|nr:hypothetical protein [Candidatus Izemoplasmatales bacterium]